MLKYFNINETSLKIGDIDVHDLVKQYGTPLFVYDIDIIKKQYLLLKNNLSEKVSIFYAVKANPNLSVCSCLKSLGAGAEIASAGELFIALKSGFNPERIIFAGPGKKDEDLEYAMNAGVSIINVESINELKRLNKIAKKKATKAHVCIRINPMRAVKKAKVQMGGGPQKFGVDEECAEEILKLAKGLDFIELLGIHIYIGSQIPDHTEILNNIENTINMAAGFSNKYNFPLKCINLGGGLGVPYDEESPDVDIEKVGKGLDEIIKKASRNVDLAHTQFILEPGRFLTSESGVYLSKIVDVKESRGKKFAIIDGGINHSMLPITMNKKYPTFIVNKLNYPNDRDITIGGPLCTSMDMFSKEVVAPTIEPGDIVGIFNSGAYGFSASMLYFLSYPLPAEIVVENGKSFIARKRGTIDDLIANQEIWK